jgi:hypothetical protein
VGSGAAIDGNLSTFSDLTSTVDLTIFVGYDMGTDARAVVTGVAYAPRPAFPDRMKGMRVEGANDISEWNSLFTVTATPAAGSLTKQAVPGAGPFRYVRLEGTAGFLNVAEVEFYGYDAGAASVAVARPAGLMASSASCRMAPRLTLQRARPAVHAGGDVLYDLHGARLHKSCPVSGVLISAHR